MPLTQNEIDSIRNMLNIIASYIESINDAILDVEALLRIHNEIEHDTCIAILNAAKTRAQESAIELVNIL